MVAQLQQAPLPPIEMMPDLPKALNDIIMISLEKDPNKRFQTAEAFAAALGSISSMLNATPVQASAGSTPPVYPSATAPAYTSAPTAYNPPPGPGSATGFGGGLNRIGPTAGGRGNDSRIGRLHRHRRSAHGDGPATAGPRDYGATSARSFPRRSSAQALQELYRALYDAGSLDRCGGSGRGGGHGNTPPEGPGRGRGPILDELELHQRGAG